MPTVSSHQLLAQTANFGGEIEPPTTAYAPKDLSAVSVTTNVETVISRGLGILTLVASLFFIFYFVMAGLDWISAAGDKSKVTKARDKMTQGAIGLAIIIISYSAIGLIGTLLGLDILRPAITLLRLAPPPPGP